MARGYVNALKGTREAARRMRVAFDAGRERVALERLSREPLHLKVEYHYLSPALLLERFRERQACFFKGFSNASDTARLQKNCFPAETKELPRSADAILMHYWPLLGFGEMSFGANVNWLKDPLTDRVWPNDYHGDMALQGQNGSDVRVLWELNRLSHFLTLGRAYAVTGREEYATEVFKQFDSWLEQNPLGHGPNWSCAMEVALRATNLLGALTICRHASSFTPERLLRWFLSLAQHGAHIKRNLEFSYLGTSNHYLTNVVGLLWLGLALPELSVADDWREWGLQQLFNELDKQVLPDGADYEGATGYHRYVLELFLYSFILCRRYNIEIDPSHWQKLRAMLQFLKHYVRPDGAAPLIGDADGSQLLPITKRRANDHSYLLPIGAVATGDSDFKRGDASQELLWLFGEDGVSEYDALANNEQTIDTKGFPSAGLYVMRKDDLYLLLNAARHHRAGSSSHRHNDALSVEVSACGRSFIVDPGSYVYSADLLARNLFRSTAYHSTIQVDDAEQNTIYESQPFRLGNDAKPVVTSWETSAQVDRVTALHSGYKRLRGKVRHQRSIVFDKVNRWWLIEDEVLGKGAHKVAVRFHLSDGVEVELTERAATARDFETGARLLIVSMVYPSPGAESVVTGERSPKLESQFVSREYGARVPSTVVMWSPNTELPCTLSWALIPVCRGEDEGERMRTVMERLGQS